MVLASIVVLTYNRCLDLKRCLDSLTQQTLKDFEVIVIDNGSFDETSTLLCEYPVRVIRDRRRNKAYLRNLGLRAACGDIIAYIDDDAVACSDWLENIVNTFEEFSDLGAVGGPTVVSSRQEMLGLYEKFKHSKVFGLVERIYEVVVSENKLFDICCFFESGAYSIGGSLPSSTKLSNPIFVDILSTCNVAVKREAAHCVGGFDENFFFNHEDGDFFLRIRMKGYKLMFNPRALISHYVNPRKSTRSSPYWMGRDFGYFHAKHVHPKNISNILRFFLNIVYFCSYWLYKTFQTGDTSFLSGLLGYALGLMSYYNISA